MDICWATPLYEFLRLCNQSELEKKVLDCGAGGSDPPLALFKRAGYLTSGVEIAPEPLAFAPEYCHKEQLLLDIVQGDMRRLPFPDCSFSFVYSFNAIFFMTKLDIGIAMREIDRVLRLGGLCFVNFISVDDPDDQPFCDSSPAWLLLKSERFAKHGDDEAEGYFLNFDILRKDKRSIEKFHEYATRKQVMLEYIARKRRSSP